MYLKIGRTLVVPGMVLLLAAGCSGFRKKADLILEETGTRGGLIVHLGTGKGKLTTALHAGEGYVVHGLSNNPEDVQDALLRIRRKGLQGKVTVEYWDKDHLPYSDNLANLLVAGRGSGLSEEEMLRVLAPGGKVYITGEDRPEIHIKPALQGTDEWTHFLHGPDNNAVGRDSVTGPPRYLQWESGPRWMRSHEHLSSVSAMVTSGGRVFSIADEAPAAFILIEPRWNLVARDAYNGVLLWRKKIDPWEHHLRDFRSGPPELSRRLVAGKEKVYATLGFGKPLVALDAATGEVVRTYKGTDGTMEIIHRDGILYLVAGERPSLEPRNIGEEYSGDTAALKKIHQMMRLHGPRQALTSSTPRPRNKRLLAVDTETGDLLWERAGPPTAGTLPLTLCTDGKKVYYQNPSGVTALDISTGEELWQADRPVARWRLGWSTPTLVVQEGILFSADRENPGNPEDPSGKIHWVPSGAGGNAPPGLLIAYDTETGKELWRTECQEGYNAPVDVLLTGDLLWSGNIVRSRDPGITAARNPRSGEIVSERPPDQEFYNIGMSHHRCYRNKATGKYIITGRAGVEFIDMATGEAIPHHWIRGSCQYGIMPANGLLYVPPHTCACYIQAKLNGLNVFAHAIKEPAEKGPELIKGPAYDKVPAENETPVISPEDWPTLRHDPLRSGSTGTVIPTGLESAWETRLHTKHLTAPVIAGGRVYVAGREEHTLYALDAASGKVLWDFTTGGRIDSPPTVHKGMLLFGSADGYVYCLRAGDGALVWKFRPGPWDRRVMACEQLESAWPVHGNILIMNDTAYFCAGRTSYLDGGLYMYGLDPGTGRVQARALVNDLDPSTGQQPGRIVEGFGMPGAKPDVLSGDGQSVFMRRNRYSADLVRQEQNVPHLYCPTGILDDSWWHRSYWLVSDHYVSGWGGWHQAGNHVPAGRIIAFDRDRYFCFGRNQYANHGSHVGMDPGKNWGFFRDRGHVREIYYRLCSISREKNGERTLDWEKKVPVLVRAMVLAGNALCISGIPSTGDMEQMEAGIKGKTKGMLFLSSPEDGSVMAKYELESPPVFDGMAAANGKLFISAMNGSMLCLTKK